MKDKLRIKEFIFIFLIVLFTLNFSKVDIISSIIKLLTSYILNLINTLLTLFIYN